MFAHFLLAISTTIHVATYALAAVYARHSDHHRDMCPFYVLIAVAAMLHLIVVIIQWRQFGREFLHHPTTPHAPIGDVKRTIYYDHRGEPFFTEWQPLPNARPTSEPIPASVVSAIPTDAQRAA